MSTTSTTTSTSTSTSAPTNVSNLQPPTPVVFETGVQYGFYFDQSRCIGCHECDMACKSWNQIPAGPLKLMRIVEWETGSFPTVVESILHLWCFHCGNPVCITNNASGALAKEPKYGAVILDPTKATTVRDAAAACPYGAIVFDSDEPDATAMKCTMCIDRLENGLYPVCVMSCPMRVFDFGPLSYLQAKYGTNANLPGLPVSSQTSPAVVFKPADPKKTLIPYDVNEALTLMASRSTNSAGTPSGLPPFYSQPSDATYIPPGLIARNQPVIKPANVAQLMATTKNDDA